MLVSVAASSQQSVGNAGTTMRKLREETQFVLEIKIWTLKEAKLNDSERNYCVILF